LTQTGVSSKQVRTGPGLFQHSFIPLQTVWFNIHTSRRLQSIIFQFHIG